MIYGVVSLLFHTLSCLLKSHYFILNFSVLPESAAAFSRMSVIPGIILYIPLQSNFIYNTPQKKWGSLV